MIRYTTPSTTLANAETTHATLGFEPTPSASVEAKEMTDFIYCRGHRQKGLPGHYVLASGNDLTYVAETDIVHFDVGDLGLQTINA